MKLCAMIKRAEQLLYSKLQTSKYDEPLKNVKNALGSMRFAKGNPLTKTEISIQVQSFFVDNVLNPILPAALPVNLQTSLPVYLFGLTDYYAGYLKSTIINPISQGWRFNSALALPSVGIWGHTLNITIAPLVFDIQLTNGDLVLLFTDQPLVWNFAAMIRIHCNNVAYGTFLNSFVSDLITISVLRSIIPGININQFVNPFIISIQSLFGKVASDSIDPRQYILSKDFQQQIVDIPINLPIDKNLILSYQLDIFCQQMSFVLFVQKIEPLTHK